MGEGRKGTTQLCPSLVSSHTHTHTHARTHTHTPGGVATPTVGSILECLVHETTPLSLTVSAPWWAGFGRVDITDAADEYTEDPLERFGETREGVRVCVVRVEGDRMDLSLRPSRLSPGQPEGDSPDREITSLGDLSEGGVVRGYVKAVTAVGVFVRYQVLMYVCTMCEHSELADV